MDNKKYNKLSIVIPCFNEIKTIEEIIKRVMDADCFGLKKEIVIVDDGSKDGSKELLKKYINKSGFKIIIQENNKGKGSALKKGFENTSGDIVLIQDADLEYDPSEYQLLLKPILDNKADIVYGSRFLGGRPHRVVYYWHSVMNNLLTTFSNMLTNINLTDMETCYKVFKGELIRKIAKELESKRFGFEPEITARLAKIKDIRFYEVGISYYGRTYKEGKHIGIIDGFRAIGEIIKFNLMR